MASLELQKAVKRYENYIERKGIDEELINAYVLASGTALSQEKDIEYGLKVSERAKSLINQFTTKNSIGDIWAVERYQQDMESTPFNIVKFKKIWLIIDV